MEWQVHNDERKRKGPLAKILIKEVQNCAANNILSGSFVSVGVEISDGGREENVESVGWKRLLPTLLIYLKASNPPWKFLILVMKISSEALLVEPCQY